MIHDLRLEGCLSTSLAGYLKALGVHRLVAEQADARATSRWDPDGVFHLQSSLDAEALTSFFLGAYAPTPIVTPWNGASGFFEGDQTSGIQSIESSTLHRFSEYRQTIQACRGVLRDLRLLEKPEKEQKPRLLRTLRASLSDQAVTWLDAVCVIGDKPVYPALLGTGGNDGHLEFANNFMQRLAELLLQPSNGRGEETETRLRAALLGGSYADTSEAAAIGQFSPGRAGGPNMTAGLEGDGRVNPWDYVLMIEGTLVFAAAVVRRLESGARGAAAAPFQFRVSSVGYGSASPGEQESARAAELWLPMWPAPASIGELRALFAEGRLEVRGRRARNGLDAARAVASLGVDRGVDRFQRFAILNRFGRNYFACPIGLLRVRQLERTDLLHELDAVFDSTRGISDPGPVISAAVRRLESAVFDACQVDRPLIEVLAALGSLDQAVSRSAKAREKVREIGPLSPEWLNAADDSTPEFRIAAAFASWRDLREDLATSWSHRGVFENLAEVALRRVRSETRARPLEGLPFVTAEALDALLLGHIDEPRIQDLLFGLSLLRELPMPSQGRFAPTFRNPVFAALRAATSPSFVEFFTKGGRGDSEAATHPFLKTAASILVRVRAGDTQGALELALRQSRASGMEVVAPIRAAGRRGMGEIAALLAALVIPLPRALEQKVVAPFFKTKEGQRQEMEVVHD